MEEVVKDTDFPVSPFCFDFENNWERINQGMEIEPQPDCKYLF